MTDYSNMKLDVSGMFPELPKHKTGRFKQTCVRPIQGYAFNPLRGFPPNQKCFCGADKKAKKCCLPILATCIREQTALSISNQWEEILSGEVTFPKPTVETFNE